ncbi:MAG: pimeloyl-CoA dehydrogenase large subunit [Alphaproteobacteria bacterium]|nr:pimeloyl-CoA dehydrogenase large subunit [Alphaproteobacteria bacterium]
MNLEFSGEHLAFQQKVRTFLEENLPSDIQDKMKGGLRLERDDHVRWQNILAKQGWMAPAWPAEYGGCGWSTVERYIFDEECGRAGAPRVIAFGTKMVGPVIYTFGSDEQKAKYLPRILNNEDWWCQGYSEPGSGSDLASLQCKAVRDGDHYIVNGTKTWTTLAQWADMIFCLVRTSNEGKRQEGISFLLIDMDQPGIEVKPIITIDGGHEVNMVHFTDVKVPVADRVGEENKGWTYAKYLLQHERGGTAGISNSKAKVGRLKEIAGGIKAGGETLMDDIDFKRDVAKVEIELQALEYTDLRYLMTAASGAPIGAEVSMLKLRGTEIQQRISELLMQAMGYYANPYMPEAMEYGWNEEPVGFAEAPPLAPAYFNIRKTSIYGGTNEIQKNIIAKMVLGL